MGRRELFIVLAVILLGAAVYEFTAPPAKNGEGFSFSKLWSSTRQGFSTSRAQGHARVSRTIAVPQGIHEVRLRGLTGRVIVIGEARNDIAADVTVDATAANQEAADTLAKAAEVTVDTLEDTVVLSSHLAGSPAGRRGVFTGMPQVVGATIKVPARLSVSVEGGSGLTVTGVAALRVDGVTGKSNVTQVAGRVTGVWSGGSLDVADGGGVDLTLSSTAATLTNLRGGVRAEVSNGSCALIGLGPGPVDIETRQAVIRVDHNRTLVTVTGSGGRVDINEPLAEVRADVRRSRISAVLTTVVPLVLSTSDDTIDLTLPATMGVVIDAIAEDGDVLARELGVDATKTDRGSQLDHAFGTGPRVTLRTSAGNIVLKKSQPR